MSFKGKKNIYLCKSCGHGFVSIDQDEGTTPFTTTCLNCSKYVESMLYAAPQEMLKDISPAVVWYTPDKAEFANLSKGSKDHVEMGGLLSRVVDG